jgi:membrane protease subunit HflK
MNWLSQVFGFFRGFQFWIVIAPWESALRVRLGKNATVLNPGPHLRIPFVDRLFVQPTRLRTVSDSGQTVTTRDGKAVTLAVSIRYAIGDIRRLYQAACYPEVTLLCLVQGLLAEAVAESRSESLVPKQLEEAVTAKIPADDWGLTDVHVMITGFAFPKVFRIFNYEYRSTTRVNELGEHQSSGS